ncbi:MAG: VanZ family protein [bacterium]
MNKKIPLNKKHRTIFRVLTLGYGLAIAAASLANLGAVETDLPSDKLLHFAAYALFTVVGYFASASRQQFVAVAVGIILYGGLLELLQGMTGYRHLSLGDFFANSAGAVIAAFLLTTFFPNAFQRRD